jgi:gluconate 2-dehydrogenase gamma chain
MPGPLSRRDFVASVGSLSAAWLLADPAQRIEASRHAATQVARQQPSLVYFTREQAAEVEAFASRIIPTDDTPGAREAGVVYFIDKSLTTWAKPQEPAFRDGLAKLPADVAAAVPGQSHLASLTEAQQDAVLRGIEQTDFFGQMRFATLLGMFSLPTYGGNKDFVGWQLLGQQPAMEFKPPFGWYDTPANMRTLLGGGDE